MIATALLTEPRLLLADEPTTALDVTTQAEVMAILDDLRREFGLAMLFITHDLELAAAVCDRTAVMYAGQIVEIRASALLHDDPLHPYTAALAGAPPGHRPDGAPAARRSPAGRCRRSRRRRTSARSRRAARTRRDVCRAGGRRSDRAGRRAVRCAARARAELRGRCLDGARDVPEPAGRPRPRGGGLRKEFGALVAVDDVTFGSRRAGRSPSSGSRARARPPSPG